MSENKTGKSENLRFFCENYSDDYSKVKCSIAKGDEFIFNKINGTYQANYCSDDKTKILIFDKNMSQMFFQLHKYKFQPHYFDFLVL